MSSLSLSLASLVLLGSVAAQAGPDLHVAVIPDRLDARISSALPGSLVALAMGIAGATTLLPGGASLDLVPLSVPAMAFANADGNVAMTVRFPLGQGAGMSFLVQAIVFDVRTTFGAPGSLQVTPRRTGHIPQAGEEADLVILFGQSNAEGHALLADVPGALRGAHPSVRIWNESQQAFEAMELGLNNMLLPLQPRVGPEAGMIEVAQELQKPVWLVKLALPQSSLGPTPGPWNEWGVNAGELYAELVRRVSSAANAVRALGLVPRVRLLCMMQGESDALHSQLAQAYANNLDHLVAQVRADLALLDCVGKRVPWFRIGLINLYLGRVGFIEVETVRAAQKAVSNVTERCDTVETSAFELASDHVHFAFSGFRELGRTFLARRFW